MASTSSAATQTPNYLRENISSPFVAKVIVLIVLETIAVILRFWSRRLQKSSWMLGDILMPLSWLTNLGLCIASLLCVRFGAGRHAVTLRPDDLVSFAKTLFMGVSSLYIFGVTLPKLAILDLYLHVFVQRYHRLACYACGLIVVLTCLAELLLLFNLCTPLQRLWNHRIAGHCLDLRQGYTWASLPNIFTDVLILVIPIPIIYKLRQNWKVKLGVIISFMVGGFGLITSIIRFFTFYERAFAEDEPDPTFKSIPLMLFGGIVEPGVYHIAACLITYRTLFHWLAHDSRLSLAVSRVVSLFSKTKSIEQDRPPNTSNAVTVSQPIEWKPSTPNGKQFGRVKMQHTIKRKPLPQYPPRAAAQFDIERGCETLLIQQTKRDRNDASEVIEIRVEPI